MSKSLFIVRGVSGAGKDTLSERIATLTFTADQYFEQKPEGYQSWNREELHTAHKWCQNQVETAMKLYTAKIAVANTFTSPREFKPYELLALEHGYQVFHIIVENRHGNDSVHDVPQDVRNSQEQRILNNIRLK